MNGKMVLAGKVAVGLGVVVLLAYLALALAGGNLIGATLDLDKSANIGTFVGGTVGALWALAGVFFFYAALKLQDDSLNELRESVRLQREDYKLQRGELEATRKVFERQNFETTFFNLLEQKNEYQRDAQSGSRISHLSNTFMMIKGYLTANPGRETTQSLFALCLQFIKSIEAILGVMCDYLSRNRDDVGDLERDKAIYMSILTSTTSHYGRILFLYYVVTCDSTFRDKALELGFFDGVPVDYIGIDTYELCKHVENRDGLFYYAPPES